MGLLSPDTLWVSPPAIYEHPADIVLCRITRYMERWYPYFLMGPVRDGATCECSDRNLPGDVGSGVGSIKQLQDRLLAAGVPVSREHAAPRGGVPVSRVHATLTLSHRTLSHRTLMS